MRITETIDFLERALPRRKVVMLLGQPGVGKTHGFYQACARAQMECIAMCSPLLQPTNVQGYPIPPTVPGGDAEHCLFDGIARAFRATVPTCLLFDDLPMASESLMKAILQLVYERRIDNRTLPEHVVVGATGNDVGMGSGVFGMIEPLKDRFSTIVTVEPSLDDTISYGLARNWPADLLAYLRNSPDALCDWKPEKSMKSGGATPRGWDFVASWVNDGFTDPEILAGKVGKERAGAYLAFRALINELPDIDGIAMAPESSPVPSNPAACWLVGMAIATRLNGHNFGQYIKYLGRMSNAMFRAFCIKDYHRGFEAKKRAGTLPKDFVPIHACREYSAWVSSADGKAIMMAG